MLETVTGWVAGPERVGCKGLLCEECSSQKEGENFLPQLRALTLEVQATFL